MSFWSVSKWRIYDVKLNQIQNFAISLLLVFVFGAILLSFLFVFGSLVERCEHKRRDNKNKNNNNNAFTNVHPIMVSKVLLR